MESAARLHRGRKVFVIFLVDDVVDVLDSRTLSYLVSYENVMLRHIRLKEYPLLEGDGEKRCIRNCV